MQTKYLFTSERLGFRNWVDEDAIQMAAINADPKVMEFFPSVYDYNHTAAFVGRLQKSFNERGYCYFAVEELTNQKFIGFIGIAYQDWESPYTPNVDIGWRLSQNSWGKGFATEGAKRVLAYAFEDLNLKYIISVCSEANIKSENVMKKIGMNKVTSFKHPKLKGYPHLEDCFLYEMKKGHFQK